MSSARLVRLLLAAALVAPPSLAAQEIRLDRPVATFPEDFGTIQVVRELPDGTLLVADPLGGELYRVDMAAGTRRVIGAQGQGPREYRQPDAVWALPGDSTLLVDLGNGRLTVLAPDLSFQRTRPIAQGGPPQPGTPMAIAIPQAVDGRGALYFRAMGGGGPGGTPPDSAPVLRLAPDGETRPVATVKTPDVTVTRSGSAGNESVSMGIVPLSAEDPWGVAPDGSLVLVRSGDYHVEWIAPDGRVTRGAPIPWSPVRIGQAEKDEWVAESGRSGGGIGIEMSVENGQASMSFSRGGGGGGQRTTDQYTWPDAKPPVYGGRIPVDPRGRAWVRRHVDAGDPSTYDLFDRQGARVATVLLEHGKRVVGFGEGAVYVVAFDEFDLNYLEKYQLPAM
ncbi:MAG: hypothetical protein RH859_04910 [Longimicrobiales bacterium]